MPRDRSNLCLARYNPRVVRTVRAVNRLTEDVMKRIAMFAFLVVAALCIGRPSPAGEEKNSPEGIIDRISVGPSVTVRGLTIFPIDSKSLRGKTYTSLDEASREDKIQVKEKGSGDVNRVIVENLSGAPVLLLGGEMIVGAKQDRMISQDTLLPPKSGPVVVAVYCVEHGRWHGASSEFEVSKDYSQNALRQSAQIRGSQNEIWEGVSQFGQAAAPGQQGQTSSAAGFYADTSVREKKDEMKGKLIEVMPERADQIGFAAVMGSRILGVDIFGSPEAFQKYRNKLIDSYIYDVLEAEYRGDCDLGRSDIRRFVEEAVSGKWLGEPTVGMGEFMELKKDRTSAAALMVDGGLIHATLFPRGRGAKAEPVIEEHPIRRPRFSGRD
jgi:hypothetical protein